MAKTADARQIVTPETGWTRAHEDAFNGCLAEDFDQWDIEDDFGVNVGDVAAAWRRMLGALRDDYYWDKIIDDKTGLTRAEVTVLAFFKSRRRND